MATRNSGDLDVTRTFIADARGPIRVRMAEASRAASRLTVNGIELSPHGVVTVPAPPGGADTVSVNVDVPAAAPGADNVAFVVEISAGTRTYREIVPIIERHQTLRFNLVYGEPEPDLIDCPRHGLVRPKDGVCPEPAPHT